MSGIFGLFYRDGREVATENLAKMREILSHRGTDRTGVWHSGSIGMGHCMRWTTPESMLERLPATYSDGNLSITADIRLDNRDELIAALDFGSFPREKITDSQLVLAAYRRWGEACLSHLLGDFAFAIWDEREQKLFCARDHYGIKPLYYYCSDRIFAFATEIKALLTLPEVPRRLNETKVADYLIPMFEDREITFYQGIYRLPPATYLVVEREKKQLQKYWSFDPERNIRLGSDAEYAEAFSELFTEAVRCRLRSNFRVGTFLSGGLDSSAITCVTKKLLVPQQQEKLPTFSAIFNRITECDERSFINTVIEQGGIKPHFIEGDSVGCLTDWQKTIWHQDEAYYAPNLFLHSELYRKAQNQNVRVLLDGFDGDTTVSHGIAYLAELTRAGNWLNLMPEIRGLAKNFERSPIQLLWRHGLEPFAPTKLRRAVIKLAAKNQQSTIGLKLQNKFARRINLKERIKQLQQGRSDLPKTSREAHHRILTAGVMPFALEAADKAASAMGIEPRYPFFDKRLMEFCLALPPEQKMFRGWTRIVMRRAMEGVLPPAIQWRGGKSNLGSNFHHGLRLGKPQLDKAMKEDTAYIADYLDLDLLRSLYSEFSSGNSLTHSDYLALWKALSLAMWLKETNLSI